MSSTVRVALVEDDERYRQSLEVLFRHAPGFSLAGSFESALPALSQLREGGGRRGLWDLVLMDLALPDLRGIEATRQLKLLDPGLSVVVVTVFEDPHVIVEAICAGADGYLLKHTGPAELLAQLRVVLDGGAPLTASIARTVLAALREQMPQTDAAVNDLNLTQREREVLHCLVQGLAYKQVGDRLGISIDTVRTHIRGVYRKLQVHSVAEAVSRAVRERLV